MESPEATLATKPAKTKVVLRVEIEVESAYAEDVLSEGAMASAGRACITATLVANLPVFHPADGGEMFLRRGSLKVEFARGPDIAESP